MRLSAPALAALALTGITLASAHGAEGMWTFDQFPADKAEKAYGFKPDQALLDQLRLSSLRIKGRCSAAFVSPQGLVQTNHHCVTSCIRALSTKAQDLMAVGFYAKEAKDELKCPGLDLDQLIATNDVTERLKVAGAAKEGEEDGDAVANEKKTIIRECAGGDATMRCEVVALHGSGLQTVYKFRTWRDVRLVMAPERAMASFGGEIDNFEFPRFAFDVAYLRVYADDQPLDTSANYFRYAKADAHPDDVVFVPGSPGWTDRLLTVAQLEFRRDVELTQSIFYNAELRGLLTEYVARGSKQQRAASSLLNSTDTALRNDKRRLAALADPALMRARTAFEKDVRTKVALDPDLLVQYGAAWDKLAEMLDDFRGWQQQYQFTAGGDGFRSQLFRFAQTLVRYATEIAKPEGERLNAFSRNLETTLKNVTAKASIDPSVEKLTLTFSLSAMRDALGAHHPFVKKVLGTQSPRERAIALIDDTSLASADVRSRLVEGGAAAIDGSNDPMIALARAVDPDWRALQNAHEEEVVAVRKTYLPLVARAIFQVHGHEVYPDASYTPRLSFGAVKGYRAAGRDIDPITTIGGLFEHATGTAPFKLPERWLAARGELNPAQPLNFTTTNDLIGGFSGAAAVSKLGEIVGVMFDINAPALGGYFGYDPAVNRAIALTVGAMREALSKVYKADRIVEELQ